MSTPVICQFIDPSILDRVYMNPCPVKNCQKEGWEEFCPQHHHGAFTGTGRPQPTPSTTVGFNMAQALTRLQATRDKIARKEAWAAKYHKVLTKPKARHSQEDAPAPSDPYSIYEIHMNIPDLKLNPEIETRKEKQTRMNRTLYSKSQALNLRRMDAVCQRLYGGE